MTLFEIIGYPLFIVAALELILGTVLLRQNTRNSPVNKSVAAFSLFSAAFALCTAVMYVRASMGLEFVLCARANWIGWFSIPAALQFIYYMKDEKSRAARRVGFVLYPFWLVIFCVSFFTDLIVPDDYTLLPHTNKAAPLELPLRLVGASLIVWIIYEIVKLRKQVSGLKRMQLNYFTHGILIFGGGGALLAGFLQAFEGIGFEPGLASYFSLPWVLFTFSAITKHRLFDIRIIVSRTLTIVLLSVMFSAIHIGLFNLLEPSLGNTLAILISLSLIGFLFFGTPFSKRVQKWIQGIVVKDKYGYQQVLKESIKAIMTILDLKELLEFVIESMRKSLGISTIYLFLRTKDDRYTIRHGFGALMETGYRRSLAGIAVGWINQTGQTVIREELEATLPEEGFGNLATYMRGIGAEVMIPLFYKDRLQGILALGQKGNRESYVQSDIDLLETLAGHAAVAMENARLYEEAGRVKESLHESEEKFRALAHTLPAAVFIHRGGKFLYANPAAVVVTGYPMEELLNMDFWGVTHPAYRQLIVERAQARLHGDLPPQQYEFKIVRKNGEERWILMSAGHIEYDGRAAVIGTAFDINERKKAEEEKARLYEENVRQYQERMEEERSHQTEKEKILRDLHDGIGGITTNIRLLAEMARNAPSLDDVKKTLSTISALAREGLGEIRGFMHSLDAKDMNWHTLTAEIRNQGSTMIASHGMSFNIQTSIEDIRQPPGSLFCLNLFRIYKEALTNIIKHSKAKAVNVTLDIRRDKLALTIVDDGIGMGEGKGTGRGLSNMKARAGEIGGEITITSEKGAAVRLELPVP